MCKQPQKKKIKILSFSRREILYLIKRNICIFFSHVI